jgi:hypothetical protein
MKAIGASPEVARDMLIADRNRRIKNLMYDSLFQSELQVFRGALIEYRKYLISAYSGAISNDIRNVSLILLHRTDEFLKLLPVEVLTFFEWSSNTMKQEGSCAAGVTLLSGEKDTCRDGVYGTYVVEHDFSRDGEKEII